GEQALVDLHRRLTDLFTSKSERSRLFSGGFSWGAACAASTTSILGTNRGNFSSLLNWHVKLNPAWSNYPWEFIIYFFHEAESIGPDQIPSALLHSKQTRGTRVTNWRLLRIALSSIKSRLSLLQTIKLRLLLTTFTKKDGFIQDQLWTRSLQYHAFSTYLLC